MTITPLPFTFPCPSYPIQCPTPNPSIQLRNPMADTKISHQLASYISQFLSQHQPIHSVPFCPHRTTQHSTKQNNTLQVRKTSRGEQRRQEGEMKKNQLTHNKASVRSPLILAFNWISTSRLRSSRSRRLPLSGGDVSHVSFFFPAEERTDQKGGGSKGG